MEAAVAFASAGQREAGSVWLSANGGWLVLGVPIHAGDYEMQIVILADGRSDYTLIDQKTKEAYALVKVASAQGAYVEALRKAGIGRVETGEFGAMMQVEIHNDGPVTILLDTDEIMK